MISMSHLLLRRAVQSKPLARPMIILAAQQRFYRGDTGDAVQELSAEEEALLKIARPKADDIFQKHIQIPGDDLATRQKRLIYRAKQRGWLEVDLLLGTWASQNVSSLEGDELDQFEDFVNMETIDIYNVITLRLDVPEQMKRDGNGVVEKIQEWARASPLGKADPEKYKAMKVEAKLI
jgi:succinate dehydrogenase flavin-adding protein (antitoxin of CptAB toxin-antitoxin module)